MKRVGVSLCIAGVLALLAGPVSAQPKGPPPQGGPPHGPPPLDRVLEDHAEELGIDEETLDAISELVEATRPELDKKHEEIRDLRRGFHELLGVDEPDRDLVLQQIEIIGEAEIALHKLEIEMLMDIRSMLTAEQRAALEEFVKERGGRDGDRRGPPPRGGPPPRDGDPRPPPRAAR
jgi:Spy/CpxP family protein refolding chaperone